jgi:protein phosphatase PTC7
MLGLIKVFQKTTCMAFRSTPSSLLPHTKAVSEATSRPSSALRLLKKRFEVMPAGTWGSHLHSFLLKTMTRPLVVAIGATTVGTGVWMANTQQLGFGRNRIAHCASSGLSSTPHSRSVVTDVSNNKAPSALTNNNNNTSSSKSSNSAITLSAGSYMIPHPAKEDKGGEDAWFICETGRCMGVADGVGGWAEIGIDPGLYSRELMAHAKVKALETERGSDMPQEILEYAHKKTMARGSCTACVLCVDQGVLHASNLGDSGFLVVRQGELAFMSPQQQHEFNFPYQLGSADSMADLPSAAQRFSIEVEIGDIVVAATDGVFDNVYPDEAAAMVTVAKKNGDSPEVAATLLAQFARTRAADPTHLSPFAYGAQQLGYKYFGGKMDDITVVCAYIENSSGDAAPIATSAEE